ncbi:hypothetical protein ABPG73_007790, partial [Tetrahymena malaccensis]
MEKEKDIQIKYQAPQEKFQELCEDYYKKHDKSMMFDSDALTVIYDELQRKGIYLTSFISEGGFGSVFEALYNQEIVAVKCIGKIDNKKIEEEQKILKLLKGTPYVFKSVKEFINKKKSKYYQVSKRYSCSLKDIMKDFFDQKKTLPLNQIIGFAIQMSTVFEKLQQNNLMHSDVKPENILYDSQDKSFHLCDFGESKSFKEGTKTYEIKGFTRKYAAPESLKEGSSFNVKYDIYSLGIILLELTLEKFLEDEICTYIRNGKDLLQYTSKNNLYQDLNKIISQMLQNKFENRINSQELTNQLNKLKLQLESQFISEIQGKIDFYDSIKTISKFKQSFLQFNYTCYQNEARLDEYSFEGKENLQEINECIENRLVHQLNLYFR